MRIIIGDASRGGDDAVAQLAADIVGRRYRHRASSRVQSDTSRSSGTQTDPLASRSNQGPSRWAWNLALVCWSIDRLASHLGDALAFFFDVILPSLPPIA